VREACCNDILLRGSHRLEHNAKSATLNKYTKSKVHREGRILQCYSTEAVVDRCLDYIDTTNPIGICKSHHKAGRLATRGCVGEKQITLDLDAF
jgi:hypothetical protein